MFKKENLFKTILKIVTIIFAIIGFIFVMVFCAMQFGWLNVPGTIKDRNSFFSEIKKKPNFAFTPEWGVLGDAFLKDKEVIQKVSSETDISERMLIATITPEQLRFFTSNRESYKKYFEPLKILGVMSQFSLGVSGMKPETAIFIEKNLTDKQSPFYLGKKYEKILAYQEGEDRNAVLYQRLTNPKDRYYQYLYTALFIKQIEKQWNDAGYNVENKPEIIATIFNLGFDKSKPKRNPVLGGAEVSLGGETYIFGELAYQFYFSDELKSYFP